MGAVVSRRREMQPVRSLTSALEHTNELPDKDDKCNAEAVLSQMRTQQDQPTGYKTIEFPHVRPRVLDYLVLHGIPVYVRKASQSAEVLI